MPDHNLKYSKEDIRKIEEELLHTSYPDEGNYNYKDSGALAEKIVKKIRKRPTRYLLLAVSGMLLIGIIVLSVMISQVLRGTSGKETPQPVEMEGFDYLVEKDRMEQDGQMGASQEDRGQTGYFVNPTIQSAALSDSNIQLGEKVYRLPIKVAELEQDGIMLVAIGTQPPNEADLLEPKMRNGYIQLGDWRFSVTLKNGVECTYKDLTVCEIIAEKKGSPVYVAGGLTIGSEEAAVPQTADRIEQDAFGVSTFYSWGSIEDTWYDITGRRLQITASRGKIDKIDLFCDGMGSDSGVTPVEAGAEP
jgi:hypothetical protein